MGFVKITNTKVSANPYYSTMPISVRISYENSIYINRLCKILFVNKSTILNILINHALKNCVVNEDTGSFIIGTGNFTIEESKDD